MSRIKLLISYDGTDFCGWQKQTKQDAKPSVQQTLEDALSSLLNEPITTFGSGRTDSGVHALGQVVHFETSKNLEGWNLCWAVRSKLPTSLVVKKAWIAPDDFHALHSATHKTYRYFVYNSEVQSALMSRYSHWVRHNLDIAYLNEVSQYLVGEHDFKSFQSTGTDVAHTVRVIYKAEWVRKNSKLLEFRVTGSGFLKQMVRAIVGTQLDLAMKGKPASDMLHIIDAKDRKFAGKTAPAQGLFLFRVFYPKSLDNQCRQL